MNRFRVCNGITMTALGVSVFFTSTTMWGLRGLIYIALGWYFVWDGLGDKK